MSRCSIDLGMNHSTLGCLMTGMALLAAGCSTGVGLHLVVESDRELTLGVDYDRLSVEIRRTDSLSVLASTTFQGDTLRALPVSVNVVAGKETPLGTELAFSARAQLGANLVANAEGTGVLALDAQTVVLQLVLPQLDAADAGSAEAPTAATTAATTVTATAATLNGTANPKGLPAVGWFRYATAAPSACDDTFGQRAPTDGVPLGKGTADIPYTHQVQSLQPNRTYSFCALASTAAGLSAGPLLSFVTPPLPPSVATAAATGVTATAATLNGTANPNEVSSSGWFRYATTNPGTCNDTFGTRAPASGTVALGSGTLQTPYARVLTGLSANTTYYHCALASNVSGTSSGAVLSFATRPLPINIGETAVLTEATSGNVDLLVVQQTTLGQPATIQSLSYYVATAAGSVRLGIYDATGQSGEPGLLRAQTASFNPNNGWNTVNVTAPVLLPAGTYWLAHLLSSSNLEYRQDRSGASRVVAQPFGAMPATYPTSGVFPLPVHWSLYATLQP
ncbi:MAG: hypothetical protein ACT4TC_14585 [Myxococcaceae bacterium]